MQPHRRAIGVTGDDRNLELARQIAEFRVEAGPLPQQFGIRAWIDQFVGRSARVMIRTDVADAVAAGLDGVHFHGCQIGQNIARFLQLDPVVLNVLAGGEMAIAAIILVRDIAQHMHLRAAQRAIGHRHAQHIGVQLQIQAVHQPQRLELVLGDLAIKAALRLIAEFRHAGIDHCLIVFVIKIHGYSTQLRAAGSAGFSVRSMRTVGPSARMRSLMWPGRMPSGVASASIA